MQICDFQNLKNTNFYINEISSIYQTPTYRSLDNPGRRCNGFLVMEEGECVYSWNGKSHLIKKGGVIYLPFGSVHKMYATTENLASTRIDFTTRFSDSKKFVFSKEPMIMCSHYDSKVMDAVHKLNELFLDATASFKIKSKLYEFFDILDNIISIKNTGHIKNTVEYIERHYTESIDLKHLVEESGLSQATLYRSFKKETGMTPVEYKNYIRIQQAKSMLKTDEYTINDISEFLGFDSIYYFSRLFRQYTGMTASEYKKKKTLY